MLQPVCRRTWAPRGHTPILRQWDRRDRLSAISTLTVAPRRRRFGLYWWLHCHNVRSADVLDFLRHLRRHLPHGFTLIWDRHRPHRATRVTQWLAHSRRIVVEWLPAYAPELNARRSGLESYQVRRPRDLRAGRSRGPRGRRPRFARERPRGTGSARGVFRSRRTQDMRCVPLLRHDSIGDSLRPCTLACVTSAMGQG